VFSEIAGDLCLSGWPSGARQRQRLSNEVAFMERPEQYCKHCGETELPKVSIDGKRFQLSCSRCGMLIKSVDGREFSRLRNQVKYWGLSSD
jgi:hypothetical protein